MASLDEQLLETGIIEQIRLGDWSPSVTDKLTHALLSNDANSEAQICSQLLQSLCSVDTGHEAVDPRAFGDSVARWVDLCDAAAKNATDQSAEPIDLTSTVRMRIEAAFLETIWVLCILWEPDTTNGDDTRWKDEQLRHLEQSRRLLQFTKALINSGVISKDTAKVRLDPDFLEQVGAVPSATAYTKRIIRLNTALLFKQTKFNLASEQSEGFTKLLTLIQSTMSGISYHKVGSDIVSCAKENPSTNGNPSTVILALRSQPDLQSRVQNLLIDIKRLIGIFNLDPNRVLDIVIDCFMASIRFYWVFYVALLDASPWCQSVTESKKVAQLIGWKMQLYANGPASDHKFVDELSTMAALLITHRLIRLPDLYMMLHPTNSEDLNAEFEAWASSQKEQQSAGFGGSSLLSKMGGLEDTGEEGEDMENADTTDANVPSEWSNHHALVCGKLLSLGDTENALFYLKRFPNLTRSHPSIADLVIRIIDISTIDVYRRTDCVRGPSKRGLTLRIGSDSSVASGADGDQLTVNAWGLPDVPSLPATETLLSLTFMLSPIVKRPSEVFFYENFWLFDAAHQLPRIDSVASIPHVLAPWLNISFQRLHLSPSLLTRLIRLCRYGMAHCSANESERSAWVGVLRSWILPAFSFCAPSAGLSNELWHLISAMPVAQRYSIYDEWDVFLASAKPPLPQIYFGDRQPERGIGKLSPNLMSMDMSLDDALEDEDETADASMSTGWFGESSQYVEIEMLHNDARRQVRSVMRRLSGDTVKTMGRQLCNLCHQTPTVSLRIVLDQVCSYDNLVDSVVEAFRYLTPLDSDVMFYIILKIVSDPTTTSIKDDGINAAHWLQSLSSFIAAFSHRHENQRLDGVLDYVLKRTISMARDDDSPPVPELTILSDTILRLAAIPFMSNATSEQVTALQGGHYLRLEAFSMVSPWVLPQDASAEAVVVASSESRLTRRLAQWLTTMIVSRGQALSFVVSLCVHAEKVLKTSTLPLSNMVVIYDREVERVYQLFHLLLSNLRIERYAKLIPSPNVLVEKYGVSWGLAILMGRPSISLHLSQGLQQWEENGEPIALDITLHQEQSLSQETETEIKAEDVDKTGDGPADEEALVKSEDSVKTEGDSQMDVDISADSKVPRTVSSLRFEAPLLPRDYVDHIARNLPSPLTEAGISAEFVAVFWALTLHDIEVPTDRYKKEIDVQNALIKRIDGMSKQSASRTRASTLSQIRSRAALAIDNLEKELLEQKQHVARIRRWLIAQKDYWFCMASSQKRQFSRALIQHCILPRAVLSASDASFCAKILWMMHFPLATNMFSLMIIYDCIFTDALPNLMATMTENESKNYARFLNTTLSNLSPLHQSETIYKERAVNSWRGLVGFQQQWRLYEIGYLPPKSRTIGQNIATADSGPHSGDSRRIKADSIMLSYEDFRTIMRKWNLTLAKAFLEALGSERIDTVRNGLLALREMQRTFPAIAQHGKRIQDRVNDIAEKGIVAVGTSAGAGSESSKNLKVMATSYGAYLAMAKKNWIMEADYYTAPARDTNRTPRSATSQPQGSQPHRKLDSRGTPSRDGSLSATTPDLAKADPTFEKPRTSAPRSISTGALAALSAASAAAASTASRPSSASNAVVTTATAKSTDTESERKDGSREHEPKRNRERERVRERERDKDISSSRVRDRDRHSRTADTDRRESRSVRGSPMHHDSDDTRSDHHRRSRENTASSGRRDTSRQRLDTPSKQSSMTRSPNIPESRVSQSSLSHDSQARRLTIEEADQKRKELRARLRKEQEEKEKQKQSIDQDERHGNSRDISPVQDSRATDRARDGGRRGSRRDADKPVSSILRGNGTDQSSRRQPVRDGPSRGQSQSAAQASHQQQSQQQHRRQPQYHSGQAEGSDRGQRRQDTYGQKADAGISIRGNLRQVDGRNAQKGHPDDRPDQSGGSRRNLRKRGNDSRDWDASKRPRK
ncbi:THO2 plays a role in transcriptional elongation [Coemansia erecta]|uniref:THO complex subunit 2 n=1 Tax=Coemansia erecta TaxID=147472 RepID=A0A9W8CNC8_9FUNG|nr:THO2 plays a role in transcriptional elongation [Coemansia erecta]